MKEVDQKISRIIFHYPAVSNVERWISWQIFNNYFLNLMVR